MNIINTLKNISMSYFVIGLNVIVFAVIFLLSMTNNISQDFYVLSASTYKNINAFVLNYFMHAGIIHLLMNMICVYQLKNIFEDIYDKKEQFVIYFLFGIPISIVCSIYLFILDSSAVAVGYSGVFMAILFSVFRFFSKTQQKNLLIFILLYHFIFIFILNFPIFWEGHLIGSLFGFAYSYKRIFFKKNKLSSNDFDNFFKSKK